MSLVINAQITFGRIMRAIFENIAHTGGALEREF